MGYYSWPKYVSVAERRQKAEKHLKTVKKKGGAPNPIVISGRQIAKTFWGKAWCENLEAYSDYANRLPRGRTYVRNGSVIDLQVTQGKIQAEVMGSSLYQIVIEIKPMQEPAWKTLIKTCAGKIDSLIELLQGKFSKAVMAIITAKEGGLFPKPSEITMRCSCPDGAWMCKHIAATLYGVGATLDLKPEWLFQLRHVNHIDLISSTSTAIQTMQSSTAAPTLQESDLTSLFGIEMDSGNSIMKIEKRKPITKKVAVKKATKKKRAVKKVSKKVSKNGKKEEKSK